MSAYTLSDRYLLDEGQVFLTGVQALARIPLEQLRQDRRDGLNTAAFVSGYPGSPLGGFDQEVARAAATEAELPIVCRPAVNEELGATAVMGSQLAAEQADVRYDGILGIWYGKAPGLDRAGDALRHAVFAGTSPLGGALALVGDDPAAKSSTIPSSSDAALDDLHIPLFCPGDVQEVLDLARHAVALSRMTGNWAALKVVSAVADGSGTVDLARRPESIITPDLSVPGDPSGRIYRPRPTGRVLTPFSLELEQDLRLVRKVLARRYVAANHLNHLVTNPPDGWLGLAATGYTYREMREALRRLGLSTPREIEAAGIRLLHLQVPFMIDAETLRLFARGLDEIVIVEEKSGEIERRVKEALYGAPEQPRIVGKHHEDGRVLMPEHGLLSAEVMLEGLRERISRRAESHLAPLPARDSASLLPLAIERTPYFCSGCPHNRSTQVPKDVLVGAGIGCHGMILVMDEERVGPLAGITIMGGEGAQWIGMAPFVERDHFIQNLGDGTYFHSGQLAIQASVAAGVNVTYKLLYNGTVAMTGGQDAVGGIGVPEIAQALFAHGVQEILITTDDLSRYRGVELPKGPKRTIRVWDRSRLLEAQRYLSTLEGVTVLIHDQACAAQARRLRKRGQAETPPHRIAINHRICEACGDCGEVSNCLSVRSMETPLGTKTTIDQSSCNFDFSCMEGDCPSFMTVTPAPAGTKRTASSVPSLPVPEPKLSGDCFDLRMVGIGGTGVVTAAQLLATAALLDGRKVRGLDQIGLSQKAGRVTGDLRISTTEPAASNMIGSQGADLILAFDLLGAASPATLTAGHPARTVLIGSVSETPTGAMIGQPDVAYPELETLRQRVAAATRAEHNRYVDAAGITQDLLGSSATANIFLIGFAYQHGVLPIAASALEEAIRLNGVAVSANLAAFAAGRQEALAPSSSVSGPSNPEVVVPKLPPALAGRAEALGREVVLRTADLVGYQNEAYAARFLDGVERAAALRSPDFVTTVATSYHQLLAYKDEYEVARLLTGPEAVATAQAVGGPGAHVRWQLHPPFMKALGLRRKLSIRADFGTFLMRLLAWGKRLRGSPLDPFGYAEVRRVERALVLEFEDVMVLLLSRLEKGEIEIEEATRIAALPLAVRGYEERKLRRARICRAEWAAFRASG